MLEGPGFADPKHVTASHSRSQHVIIPYMPSRRVTSTRRRDKVNASNVPRWEREGKGPKEARNAQAPAVGTAAVRTSRLPTAALVAVQLRKTRAPTQRKRSHTKAADANTKKCSVAQIS